MYKRQDTITGGADSDVAVFAGKQSDYTFASSADGLTITVTDVATSDADTITQVETLRFADGDIGVSHDGSNLVLTGTDAITDDIKVVGTVAVTVKGVGGADTLTGGLGDDVIDGGDEGDIIAGGAGADTIEGGAGADTISGEAGTDTITGGTGNDVIDGGSDTDTVIFAGNKGDFTFAVASNGTLTVTDVGTGNTLGVDTVSGVEKLRFDDGELTVTTTAGGGVTLTGSGVADDITLP